MSGYSTAGRLGTQSLAIQPQAASSGRISIIFFYVLAAASLALPYVHPSLDTVRWVALCTVSVFWLLANYQWWTRLALRPWICVLLLLNVLLFLASSLWSETPMYTFARAVSLALLFVLLLVFTARVVRERHEGLVLNLVMLHGLVLLLPGLILKFVGLAYVPWTQMPLMINGRYAGILWNPNQVAVTGVIIFPLAFALWWQSKRRIWILAILAVFILSIYFSQSRNGILGLSVSIAVFFAVRYRIRWIFPLALLLTLFGWLVYQSDTHVQDAVHRFVVKKENIRIEDVSITEVGRNRLMVWEPIMEKIREHPWQGSGFATGGTMHEKKHLMAHNSYLQVIQETGFIGLALILPLLLALLYVLFKISILHAPLPDRAIWAGIAATVAGGLANATFESWLLSLGNPGTLPFWLCAFLILSLIQKKQKKQKQVAYA